LVNIGKSSIQYYTVLTCLNYQLETMKILSSTWRKITAHFCQPDKIYYGKFKHGW